MKTFQGRVVTPGCAQAEALVTHGGLNTLASFQKSLQFGDKTAKCGDQNNPDLYGKPVPRGRDARHLLPPGRADLPHVCPPRGRTARRSGADRIRRTALTEQNAPASAE